MAREIVERYDEGVFDDGAISQTEEDENSVVNVDSDDEDEIEHFDSTDSIILAVENIQPQTNLDNSKEGPVISLGKSDIPNILSMISLFVFKDEEEVYDNVQSTNSSITNENDNNTLRNFSDA